MLLSLQKWMVHLTIQRWKAEASTLIDGRNINVSTNFCDMSLKCLMSDESCPHDVRGFLCIFS